MLGELDCRSSLLHSVYKWRYDCLEDAIAFAVKIHVKAMAKAARERRLVAYVHPVPPVLDASRPIVRAYNAALRAKVTANSVLTWLDVSDELCLPAAEDSDGGSGGGLRPEYKLDGTHLAPSYLPLLQAAIDAAHV